MDGRPLCAPTSSAQRRFLGRRESTWPRTCRMRLIVWTDSRQRWRPPTQVSPSDSLPGALTGDRSRIERSPSEPEVAAECNGHGGPPEDVVDAKRPAWSDRVHGPDPRQADDRLMASSPAACSEGDAADGQPEDVPEDAAGEIGVPVPEVEAGGHQSGEGSGGGLVRVETGMAAGESQVNDRRSQLGPSGARASREATGSHRTIEEPEEPRPAAGDEHPRTRYSSL